MLRYTTDEDWNTYTFSSASNEKWMPATNRSRQYRIQHSAAENRKPGTRLKFIKFEVQLKRPPRSIDGSHLLQISSASVAPEITLIQV